MTDRNDAIVLKVKPSSELSKERESALEDREVQYREVAATLSPNSSTKPNPIVVRSGYGFYFQRAVNNGWTDNKNNGSNPPLEGYPYADENEFAGNLNRAQLFGYDAGDNSVAPYWKQFDRSQSGFSSYVNQEGRDWVMYWYMNDNQAHYDDNRGTANIDVVIYRI